MSNNQQRRSIWAVYLMNTFDSLANSLFGIFVPVYLLQRGYGVRGVVIYYAVSSLVLLLGNFMAAAFMNRFGVRILMLARFPILFLYIGLLLSLPKIPGLPLWLLAAVSGIQSAFYYFANRVIFARNVEVEEMEKEVGQLYLWPKIACIFLPLIGSALVILKDFNTLILAAFALYLLAALPLWFVADFKSEVKFSLSKFKDIWQQNARYTVIEMIKKISEDVELVIWPIFIFLFFRDVLSFGLITVIFSIGGALFTWLVGHYAKRLHKTVILRWGLVASAILWLCRYFFPGQAVYEVTALLFGFVGAMVTVPYSSFVFKIAKTSQIDEFFVFREIPSFVGRLPVYLLALVFWQHLEYGFLLAAAALLALTLIRFKRFGNPKNLLIAK